MTTETAQERSERIFHARLVGEPLKRLARAEGVSEPAIHGLVSRAGRRHIERLIPEMWAAQKAGDVLILAVPDGPESDQRLAVAYLNWLLSELPEWGVRPRVHYRPVAGGGFAFGLEDESFNPVTGEITR